jgi:N utilization substance protein A
MTPEQLEAIEGIGPKTVEKISLAVNNYFSSLEGGEGPALVEGEAQEAAEETSAEEVACEAQAEVENQEVAAAAEETEPVAVDDLAAHAEGGEEEKTPAEPKE